MAVHQWFFPTDVNHIEVTEGASTRKVIEFIFPTTDPGEGNFEWPSGGKINPNFAGWGEHGGDRYINRVWVMNKGTIYWAIDDDASPGSYVEGTLDSGTPGGASLHTDFASDGTASSGHGYIGFQVRNSNFLVCNLSDSGSYVGDSSEPYQLYPGNFQSGKNWVNDLHCVATTNAYEYKVILGTDTEAFMAPIQPKDGNGDRYTIPTQTSSTTKNVVVQMPEWEGGMWAHQEWEMESDSRVDKTGPGGGGLRTITMKPELTPQNLVHEAFTDYGPPQGGLAGYADGNRNRFPEELSISYTDSYGDDYGAVALKFAKSDTAAESNQDLNAAFEARGWVLARYDEDGASARPSTGDSNTVRFDMNSGEDATEAYEWRDTQWDALTTRLAYDAVNSGTVDGTDFKWGILLDPEKPYLKYSMSGLPSGLEFDPSNRVIHGAVDAADATASTTVTYTATDFFNNSTSVTFTWTAYGATTAEHEDVIAAAAAAAAAAATAAALAAAVAAAEAARDAACVVSTAAAVAAAEAAKDAACVVSTAAAVAAAEAARDAACVVSTAAAVAAAEAAKDAACVISTAAAVAAEEAAEQAACVVSTAAAVAAAEAARDAACVVSTAAAVAVEEAAERASCAAAAAALAATLAAADALEDAKARAADELANAFALQGSGLRRTRDLSEDLADHLEYVDPLLLIGAMPDPAPPAIDDQQLGDYEF